MLSLAACQPTTYKFYQNTSLTRSDISVIKTNHDFLKIVEIDGRQIVNYISDYSNSHWPSIIELNPGYHELKIKYLGYQISSLFYSFKKNKSYILKHKYEGYHLVFYIEETDHIPMSP